MNTIIETIRRLFGMDLRQLMRRLAATVFGLCLVIYGAFEYLNYNALEKLGQFDFNLRPVSGLIVFSEPKHLQVGQRLSLKEVEDHLRKIDYARETGAPAPGKYAATGATLVIEPLFPEHSPVRITFEKDRIAKIEKKPNRVEAQTNPAAAAVWQAVGSVVIEPEKLQTSIMESQTGVEQPELFQEMNVRRKIATRPEVVESDFLICVKAVEDGNFERHNGVDFWSLLRIPYKLLTEFKLVGSSTVEMQAIRNTVLNSKERGLAGVFRKIDELILASNLKAHYRREGRTDREIKEEILTLYANSCYLGKRKGFPNVYGFSSAAELYYGKNSLKELSLGQMMTLVVLNHGPNNYIKSSAGTVDYEKLRRRRDAHLDKLYELLPPARHGEIAAAKREPVRFIDRPAEPIRSELGTISLPFVKYAYRHPALTALKTESPEKYSHLNIYTPLDADLMRAANSVLRKNLPVIAKKYPPQSRVCRLPDKNGNPLTTENALLATIVASNARTGEILTFYGASLSSRGFQDSSVALNLEVQPASVYKSWVTAEAFGRARLPDGRRFTPLTPIPPTGRTIRELLKDSDNDAPQWLCGLSGMTNDCALDLFAQMFGRKIEPRSPKDVPLGLSGGQEMPALRINESFNIFANRGRFIRSTPFAHLYVDGRLEPAAEAAPAGDPAVLDEGRAYLTANILKDVIANGTAAAAFRAAGLPESLELFGKSGSGRHFTLFVGSSPEITISVIVNYECPTDVRPFGKKTFMASDTATVVWMEYLREVQKYRPDLLDEKLPVPPDVVELPVDRQKACHDPQSRTFDYFLREALPPDCAP